MMEELMEQLMDKEITPVQHVFGAILTFTMVISITLITIRGAVLANILSTIVCSLGILCTLYSILTNKSDYERKKILYVASATLFVSICLICISLLRLDLNDPYVTAVQWRNNANICWAIMAFGALVFIGTTIWMLNNGRKHNNSCDVLSGELATDVERIVNDIELYYSEKNSNESADNAIKGGV